jgi:N-carbamoyl-L-amino-acid hydrolase
MEVVHYLNAHQITLPFTLEVADFLGEELNLWGTSCLGSRHMAGLLNAEMLARRDETGRILGEEIAACGGTGMPPAGARPDAADILACFELHIEQARSLYNADIDIGVVTALPAIDRYAISVTGAVGHSGTTPMDGRKDALVCASGIIQKISTLAHDIAIRSNQHFVATIGKLDVLPNGATIIPGQVKMTLDVRSASTEAKSEFLTSLSDTLDESRQKTRCDIDLSLLATTEIAPMDSNLQAIISEQAQALSLPHSPLASGAGHDSAHLSRFAPAAMIFIPCVDGLSHCAEELTSSDAIAKGAAVIIRSILSLAEQEAK